MRGLARRAIATALLPAAVLRERWGQPGIRILMYHRVAARPAYDQLTVGPARFERQMAYLASRHRLISLGDAVAELESGTTREGVVVTFDDGYRDNLDAVAILRRHGVPATVFVTAAFCSQLQRHPRYPDEVGRLHLDWEELRALSRDPLITIGSHTVTHPFLARLDAAAARDEIAGSREVIARAIGQPVEFFCYPSGDFGTREVEMVRAAGYRAAVSVAPGANRRGTARLALHRTEVTDRDEPFDLYAKLRGAYDLPHELLHRRRRDRFDAAARGLRPPAPPDGLR